MKAHDYLDFHAQHQPDAEFAKCGDRRFTYREAQNTSNRVARALINAGLEPGDRLAIIASNSFETAILYQGAFKAGVAPTPINVRLTPLEWQEICEDAQVKVLFCDAQAAVEVDAFRGQLSNVGAFVIESSQRPGWIGFDQWLAPHSSTSPNVIVKEDHEALQVYTSGTTGKPKGVVLTHDAITTCIAQLELVVRFQPTDRFLLIMPLFHAAGIIAMIQTISAGASLLIHRSFVAADAVKAMDTQAVTVTMLAPTMLQKCLQEVSNIADRRFETLRLIIYGASPIREDMLREAMEVFDCDFAQRYGSTETLCMAWLTPEEHRLALNERPDLLRSAGRALPGVQIRVVNADQETLPTGDVGELIVSSPALMRGYWKLENDSSFHLDGERWLETGDVGYQDSDGYLYLCDRVNDVIISGGENIYPHEIEEVLLEHPEVYDAAVIGVPHSKWGEELKALVAPQDQADISESELIEFCRERLASFKTPHSVDFVPVIPRGAGGKVLRRALRRPYWTGRPRPI